MPKRAKHRQTLDEILRSCSDTLFPADMGHAPVTVESRGPDGDTPLHVMLWRNDTYAVRQLIEAGADVNAVGDMSETPLHIAVKKQNADTVAALLDAGANVSSVSEFGQSPAELADAAGTEIRRLLQQR